METTIRIEEIEKLYHFLRSENNKMFVVLHGTMLKQLLKSKRWFLAFNLVNILIILS